MTCIEYQKVALWFSPDEKHKHKQKRRRCSKMTGTCKYCGRNKEREFFECYGCGEQVHLHCLREPPGPLLGDVFFTFLCRYCNGEGTEKLERDRMGWLDVVLLAVYNLGRTSPDASSNGFFHLNKHIIKFIDSHWKRLFPHVK